MISQSHAPESPLMRAWVVLCVILFLIPCGVVLAANWKELVIFALSLLVTGAVTYYLISESMISSRPIRSIPCPRCGTRTVYRLLAGLLTAWCPKCPWRGTAPWPAERWGAAYPPEVLDHSEWPYLETPGYEAVTPDTHE